MKVSAKERAAQRRAARCKSLTIQPGCLYWDITEKPIGSRAARAPDDGLTITDIERISTWHGCDRIGYSGGRKIAFTTEYTREYYHAK